MDFLNRFYLYLGGNKLFLEFILKIGLGAIIDGGSSQSGGQAVAGPIFSWGSHFEMCKGCCNFLTFIGIYCIIKGTVILKSILEGFNFAKFPLKASGAILMGHSGAAAIFATGRLGVGGGFPSEGGGGTDCIRAGAGTAAGGFCTSSGFPPDGGGAYSSSAWEVEEDGMELLWTSGVELVWIGGADRLGALNEGPVIILTNGAHAFPFVVVEGKEPRSAVAGLVCPKIKPVCRVGGWLGHPRDNFWVAATMVCSVVFNISSTVSSSSAGILHLLGVWKLTGQLLRYIQWWFLLSYLISFPRNSVVPIW